MPRRCDERVPICLALVVPGHRPTPFSSYSVPSRRFRNILKRSFSDAPGDAAKAFMGYGTLNFRFGSDIFPRILFLNRSNNPMSPESIERLAESIAVFGIEYDHLDSMVVIAVRRSWITDEAVGRLRAAPPPPWGREDNLSQDLRTVALDYSRIGHGDIIPLSGR
ncbi:hypothetical protein DL93DRAFT_2103641, partial [Clavulina sp. PMI_390]